ncbi:hypothetical protein [Pseudarthrobacter sp. S6]|uniref:hypothetical protein n=1 Tax=Pseudarthrobacter sp. S6 TaxID=3418420 RepID=UPI003CE9879D
MPVILVQKPRFAEIADLQYRLNKTFTAGETDWLNAILGDATEHLRSVLGWQVYPQATVTVRTKVNIGDFYRIPVQPVQSIGAVLVDGSAVTVDDFDGGIQFKDKGIAEITFTAGYAVLPSVLTSWTCVLAAQAIEAVKKLGMLSSAGLSSVSIDDFKMAWAGGGEGSGFVLPERVVEQLRSAYGSSSYVTGSVL